MAKTLIHKIAVNKCPSCLKKILGGSGLGTVRHLLTKHKDKYSNFLKEIKDLRLLYVDNNMQQILQYSAKVFEYGKAGNFYFKCNLCPNIYSQIQNFFKHHNKHNKDDWLQFIKNSSILPPPPLTEQLRRSKRKLKEQTNLIETEIVSPEKSNKKQMPKAKQAKRAVKLINNKKNDDLLKSKYISCEKLKKNQISKNKKTKIVALKQESKQYKKPKIKRQLKKLVKVKTKNPVKQFPTLNYNCKFCQKDFKGFINLQKHLMSFHESDEFKSCKYCRCVFTSEITLARHEFCRHSGAAIKCKRKQTANVNMNSNEPSCSTRIVKSFPNNEEPTWLEELSQLSERKKTTISFSSTDVEDVSDEL